MSTIIDRRLNTGAKNLGNRQRFIRRARDQIQKSIRDNLGNRPISDTTNGEKIRIPIDTIREPNFGHDWNTGESRRVLPGNQDFVPNDTIKRPVGGQGKGRGNQASDSDETGEDEFAFELTRDEFYDLFFEDLELPDMIRRQFKTTKSWEIKREGISTAGNPSNLNVIRTMTSSLGRRIILRKPNEKEIRALEEELTQTDPNSDRYQEILSLIESLTRKVRAVTYVDPIDLRYNVFSKKPTPSNSAVMFCVMDVSASMDEHTILCGLSSFDITPKRQEWMSKPSSTIGRVEVPKSARPWRWYVTSSKPNTTPISTISMFVRPVTETTGMLTTKHVVKY